jgi:hypothetical protein
VAGYTWISVFPFAFGRISLKRGRVFLKRENLKRGILLFKIHNKSDYRLQVHI